MRGRAQAVHRALARWLKPPAVHPAAAHPTYHNVCWTNPLRGSRDFGRGSDFAGWVGDKHPRLPLAGQLNRETMTWRHVALFVSQRSCQ